MIALKDFYKDILEVELPFGRIFTPNIACEQSKNKPFNPDWFVLDRIITFPFGFAHIYPMKMD